MATLSELKTRVNDLTDNDGEDIVSSNEIVRYINEGIKKAEAEIHNLYEDYFLTTALISVTADSSDYSLPSDIYARKIRGVYYNEGVGGFSREIKPLVDLGKIRYYDNMTSNKIPYKYRILNSVSSGVQLRFYPTPKESSSTRYSIYYLRNAAQLSSDSDVLDIPEFEQYVVDFARYRILEKEQHPMLVNVEKDLNNTLIQMITTLRDAIPDGNSEILQDDTHYASFVDGCSDDYGYYGGDY